MSGFSFKKLPENATVSQKLDVAINRACLAYHVIWRSTEVGSDGLPTARHLERFNTQLLRLIYIGDARARCSPKIYKANEDIAYVRFIKKGFQRLGQVSSSAAGHEGNRFLSDSQVDLQSASLHDALDRFANPAFVGLSPRQYAEGVAAEEIAKSRLVARELAAGLN